jgi:hypothetical protein
MKKKALVRHTDPTTSHLAAASVDVTKWQAAVFSSMVLYSRPVTDEELVADVLRHFGQGSPSGIRSRRSELERAGVVECTDHDGVTKGGRKCRRFQIVPGCRLEL